ncbi:ubiquitin-conjugating enzyme e2S, putative [Schistosoma mansoni]|uniref:E2 ubiquitin-conjugating enzyme n=1 Tax=Schistosoma mansoni TaxID=6183 RepID=A0A3Q0KTX5_SCHMA|nr:ubiquitin-conjugating enzyme e2S, putative [Schistosoma mansoni]|eukprot:XP_018644848.1 ubiquitin-conjugating enzyme e2S, putative [Schistosoma mansoni]
MENAVPEFARRLYKEWRDFTAEPIEGIQLILNEQDMTEVQVVFDGPVGTPYDGGKFRLKMLIPLQYPIEPPKAYFCTKIFHPNIAPNTGEVCVNTLKKDWKSNLGLRHILLTIRCLLIEPNPESALNEEAGKLLLEDYSEFVAEARLLTEVHAYWHVREQTKISSQKSHKDEHASVDMSGNSTDTRTHSKVTQRNNSSFRKALKRL